MEITHTVAIDAPVDRVWALTLDVESLPSITPTITRVERLDAGPLAPGSLVRLTQPGLPPRIWTVEQVEAPRRFVWVTRLLGARLAGVHELTPIDGDRCELTLRVLLEGRTAGLLGALGGRSIARAVATEAAGFAEAVSPTNA